VIGIVDRLLGLLSLFGFLEGDEMAVSGDGYMPDQHLIGEFYYYLNLQLFECCLLFSGYFL
jgi:hypothetical protein